MRHNTPLARFVMHNVPVVVATDNDGVFAMLNAGPFPEKSVQSELWQAAITGCLAPHIVYEQLRLKNACVPHAEPDRTSTCLPHPACSTDFWTETWRVMHRIVADMHAARFGRDLPRRAHADVGAAALPRGVQPPRPPPR